MSEIEPESIPGHFKSLKNHFVVGGSEGLKQLPNKMPKKSHISSIALYIRSQKHARFKTYYQAVHALKPETKTSEADSWTVQRLKAGTRSGTHHSRGGVEEVGGVPGQHQEGVQVSLLPV